MLNIKLDSEEYEIKLYLLIEVLYDFIYIFHYNILVQLVGQLCMDPAIVRMTSELTVKILQEPDVVLVSISTHKLDVTFKKLLEENVF